MITMLLFPLIVSRDAYLDIYENRKQALSTNLATLCFVHIYYWQTLF